MPESIAIQIGVHFEFGVTVGTIAEGFRIWKQFLPRQLKTTNESNARINEGRVTHEWPCDSVHLILDAEHGSLREGSNRKLGVELLQRAEKKFAKGKMIPFHLNFLPHLSAGHETFVE